MTWHLVVHQNNQSSVSYWR